MMYLLDIDFWVWIAGILNVFFLLPQAVIILKNKSSKNVSILTYILAIFIQIIGAIAGYVYNIQGQMWTLSMSACVSISIITLILYYKK